MHRCLSCNQPCSLFSAFCDTCRASLLARRDQENAGEQSEIGRAGDESAGEGEYPGWEMGDGIADLMAFPQPEAALVSSQAEQVHVAPSVPVEPDGAWSFETSGIYAMKTMDNLTEARDEQNKAGGAQATHAFAVPPRPRHVMPRNVRRALMVFCIVGVLALVTDGLLLALSLTRHHVVSVSHTKQNQPGQPGVDQQVASPVPGFLTPTNTALTSLLVLSSQRAVFNAVEGQVDLAPQTITLSATHQGFVWRASPVNTAPAWVHLSTWQGSAKPDATTSFTVNAHPSGLAPGSYSASIQVKAFDNQGQPLASSPLTLVITLNVHPPCVLSVDPARLSFASVLVSSPAPQTLTLNISSACSSLPISWQVTADASWVTFSRSSGSDSASGDSILVQASSADKLIGSYTAHITFRGIDGSGVLLVVSPASIIVTLTVIA